METFWNSWGWWCLLPLLVFGLMAVACVVMGLRRGCRCGSAMQCSAGPAPQPPRGPAA